ncbi:MAG: VOC family protein [Acidimicrobiia bacterium]|nr:VOC family protein [Acidimicrobiia bacterium]NNC74466.1 biphenyl-2,3-diol 1,2-dioxygenase [Acidimicrobiia bacterium]
MGITGFDHIVLAVDDVEATIDFYEKVLDMTAVEHIPGKWALRFGSHKISLQPAEHRPPMAIGTTPGSGNFCVLSDEPVQDLAKRLTDLDVPIEAGPVEKVGATGSILSVYFRDPDGNLVEVSNSLA